MKKLLLSIVVCLTACTKYIDPPVNYAELSNKLTVGMAKEEVIRILGVPKEKTIKGNEEVYYYHSRAETDLSTSLVNYTLLLPVGFIIGQDPIDQKRCESHFYTYFNENGKLSKFNTGITLNKKTGIDCPL